jgi:two-component system, cell cycle sensor histidine kinase and response regulator CckA
MDHSRELDDAKNDRDHQLPGLRLLSEVAAELLKDSRLSAQTGNIYRRVADFLDCDVFTHMRLVNDELHLVAAHGIDEATRTRLKILKPGELLCGQVAQLREPIFESVVRTPNANRVHMLTDPGLRCYAGCPLLAGDRLIGVLTFGSTRKEAFSAHDQEFIRTIAHYVAITIERQADREQLGRSEQHFRAFFESSNVGMSEWTFEGDFIRANDKCCEMLGYNREEFMKVRSYDLLHPDDRINAVQQIHKVRQGLLTEYTGQRRYIHQDGRILHAQIYVAVSRRDAAGPSTLATVAIDLTAQKQLEDQVRHAQKMDAVGQLADGIAHDLNNLLTVINGYPDLMLLQMSPTNPQRLSLEAIQAAGEKAARLTRQLLAFSRRAIVEPQILDVNQIVTQCIDMLRRLLNDRIQLRTKLAPELRLIVADPGQIAQVIVNLVVNARDALPDGGEIVLETRNAVPSAKKGDNSDDRITRGIRLIVKDNGTGILPEVKSRIFEPFFTTKAIGKGTGLGLSVVHGIVSETGGSVHRKSAPGKGTTVTIHFPGTIQNQLPEETPESAGAGIVGTETILLVEDDHSVRQLARAALEAHGYNVVDASRSRDAIMLLNRLKTPIHVLVTDILMPEMSGLQLAAQILRDRPEMAVVYITGFTDDNPTYFGSGNSAEFYLQKPFSPLSLAKKVREALDSRVRGNDER